MLTFSDGAKGEVDLSDRLWGPAFAPLRDRGKFERVRVDEDAGTVVWPNGADFAPETLREELTPIRASAGGAGPRHPGSGRVGLAARRVASRKASRKTAARKSAFKRSSAKKR